MDVSFDNDNGNQYDDVSIDIGNGNQGRDARCNLREGIQNGSDAIRGVDADVGNLLQRFRVLVLKGNLNLYVSILHSTRYMSNAF
jgi:hypothetical protein